jgi:hypothetical protein
MSADSFLAICKHTPFGKGSRLPTSSFPREDDTESRVNHIYLWLLTTATPFMGPWGPGHGVYHVSDHHKAREPLVIWV